MQSAPPEASQNATLIDQPSFPSPPTQHGFSDDQRQASGGTASTRSPRVSPSTVDDIDNVSISSAGTQRGRSTNAGRISSRDASSQDGSPGSRIDEYERAHVQSRKRSDGMVFQIIPSTKGKTASVTIESFPNGTATLLCTSQS